MDLSLKSCCHDLRTSYGDGSHSGLAAAAVLVQHIEGYVVGEIRSDEDDRVCKGWRD